MRSLKFIMSSQQTLCNIHKLLLFFEIKEPNLQQDIRLLLKAHQNKDMFTENQLSDISNYLMETVLTTSVILHLLK